MKRILTLAVCVVLLLTALAFSASATIKESSAVGDIVYVRYSEETPNMKEGIIDDTWGEKLFRITAKTKNCGIYINTWDYKSEAKPEMDTYCDIWVQYTDDGMYFAFQTNDTTPLGGKGGDSVCYILEANNPTLTYICPTDPDTMDRYNYFTMGCHLSDDDYTLEDYGMNDVRLITWYEKNGIITIKFYTEFPALHLKPSDLEKGVIVNFCFMRNILSNPDHWASGDGQMYWGKYFTDLGDPPYYVRDNERAQGANSFVLMNTNTKQYMTDKLMTDEEYTAYMGVAPASATPETPAEEAEQPSSWAAEEVNKAIALGLVPADLQKNYTKGITRGQLATMLSTVINAAYGKAPTKTDAKFTDTTDAAVLQAANLGIINGYKQADGTYMFKPANTLKRSEMSAIINRVAKLCGKTTTGFESEVKFTDTTSHWCNSELGYPVHMGIVKGTSATTFSPENTLTVEQTIMMVYRTFMALK